MQREFPRGKRDFPNYVCSSDFNVYVTYVCVGCVFLLGLGRDDLFASFSRKPERASSEKTPV